jgi:hypothetical protein
MKKLTGALVLSLSLLMASGCRSAGEPKEGEDASTPAPGGAVDAARGTINNGSGSPSTGATKPASGVDLSLMKPDSDAGTGSATGTSAGTGTGTDPAAATPAGKGTSEGATAAPLSEEARAAQEACVDKWLNGKKMDRYGHPEGTMYAGGSPIFNEQTGEMTDRLEYVYKRQPEAKKACGTAGATKPTPAQKK